MARLAEQKRATAAYNRVSEVLDRHPKQAKEYLRQVRDLPSKIQQSGLGQTLAFLRSKSKSDVAYGLAHTHLESWLTECGYAETSDGVLPALMQRDSATYRRAMVDALAFAGWLKRFAEGRIQDEEKPG